MNEKVHLMRNQYVKILIDYHKDLTPVVINFDKDIIQCYNLKYPNHFSTNCVIYFNIEVKKDFILLRKSIKTKQMDCIIKFVVKEKKHAF